MSHPPDGGDPVPVRNAAVLFIAVILLLGAFFVGILLITIGRRHRTSGRSKTAATEQLDPWREAGRRAEPLVDQPSAPVENPDPDDDLEDDDDDGGVLRR